MGNVNGFILESKSILDSEIWSKPPLYFKVWHYLLLNANFKDDGFLKRGQLITSVEKIRSAMSYQVGFRTETPQRREIQRILEFLRGGSRMSHECRNERSMIVVTNVASNVAGNLLVTICNFNKYQDFKTYECRDECRNERSMNVATNGQRTDSFLFIKNERKKERKNIGSAKPSLEDITEYVLENSLNVNAEEFYDYYESCGWMVSKGKPMKDWKAAVRNWSRRSGERRTEKHRINWEAI